MAFLPRRITLAALVAGCLAAFAAPAAPAIAASSSTPAPPVLTSPADDPSSSHPLQDVVLEWTTVPGASKYQVQVSPNEEWTNNTVSLPDSGYTVNTLFEMPISLPHASYFWHVRAKVGTQWTLWSSPRQFFRELYPGTLTVTHAPTMDDPTVTWAPVPHASLYRVRFSTSPNFGGEGTSACWTHQTSFTPYAPDGTSENGTNGCFDESALTNGTAYYWEIIAWDDSTAPPLTADTQNDPGYVCETSQPECVAIYHSSTPFLFKAPVAGSPSGPVTGLTTSFHGASTVNCATATPCPVTPTFSWAPVSGANIYHVQVYRDAAETNTYRAYNTAWPELTPRDSYFDAQAGQSYYWTVTAGTCENSPTDPTCAGTAAASMGSSCPTGAGTSSPTISKVAVAPSDGTTIQGGTSAPVTLTGTHFDANPCVTASTGSVASVTRESDTEITFVYSAPTTAGQATFTVTNSDGAVSNDSPAVTITAGDNITYYATSGPSAFHKSSGYVPLTAPANGATVGVRNVTFQWGDFQNTGVGGGTGSDYATGSDGSYDAENYELQIATDPQFSNVVKTVKTIDMTRYTDPAGMTKSGTFYWRVAAIDESGNVLSWQPTSEVRHVTVNSTAPKLTLKAKKGMSITGDLHLSANEPVSGVTSNHVSVVAQSTGKAVAGQLSRTSSTTWTFNPSRPLTTGETYLLRVLGDVHDSAGNGATIASTSVRVSKTADSRSKAWSFGHGWSKHSASGAHHGSYELAKRGHKAHLTVVGSQAVLYGCKSPSMGRIKVSAGGHTTTVSEKQSYTRCGVVVWHRALGHGPQRVTVTVASGHGSIDELHVK